MIIEGIEYCDECGVEIKEQFFYAKSDDKSAIFCDECFQSLAYREYVNGVLHFFLRDSNKVLWNVAT